MTDRYTEIMNNLDNKWSDLSIKERIQYICAIALLVSGVLLAFLSFFLNEYNIETGILIYIAQAFITAGGIFGVSVYFKSKLGEFDSNHRKELRCAIDEIVERVDKRYQEE